MVMRVRVCLMKVVNCLGVSWICRALVVLGLLLLVPVRGVLDTVRVLTTSCLRAGPYDSTRELMWNLLLMGRLSGLALVLRGGLILSDVRILLSWLVNLVIRDPLRVIETA